MNDPTGDLGIDKQTAWMMLIGLVGGAVLIAGLLIYVGISACKKWRNRKRP